MKSLQYKHDEIIKSSLILIEYFVRYIWGPEFQPTIIHDSPDMIPQKIDCNDILFICRHGWVLYNPYSWNSSHFCHNFLWSYIMSCGVEKSASWVQRVCQGALRNYEIELKSDLLKIWDFADYRNLTRILSSINLLLSSEY